MLRLGALTTPSLFAEKIVDVPLSSSAEKAALLAQPPNGRHFIDLLVAEVHALHGLQVATETPRLAAASSSGFQALTWDSSDEEGESKAKKAKVESPKVKLQQEMAKIMAMELPRRKKNLATFVTKFEKDVEDLKNRINDFGLANPEDAGSLPIDDFRAKVKQMRKDIAAKQAERALWQSMRGQFLPAAPKVPARLNRARHTMLPTMLRSLVSEKRLADRWRGHGVHAVPGAQ